MNPLDKVLAFWLLLIVQFLAAFLVAESSSRLALHSGAEPRTPVQALLAEGANEGVLALAFCVGRPEQWKFRYRVVHAVVSMHVRLLLDPGVKP